MNDRRVRVEQRDDAIGVRWIERIGKPDVVDAGVSANTSASPSFAQQMPTAPRSICQRATSGLLWVLECGRRRMPRAFASACMRSRLRSAFALVDQDRGGAKESTVKFCVYL